MSLVLAVLGVAATVLSEDYGPSPTHFRADRLVQPPAYYQHQDELGFTGLSSASGSAGVVTVLVCQPVRAPQVFTDTEELATLIASMGVEADAWTPTRYAQPSVRQPVLGTDEDHAGVLGGVRIDEDSWTFTLCPLPSFRQPLVESEETHASPLGGLRVDEDYWVGNPYVGPTFKQPLLDSDEDHAGLLGGLRVDESEGPVPRSEPVRFLQPVFDDEAVAPTGVSTVVEEESAPTLGGVLLLWNRQAVLDTPDELRGPDIAAGSHGAVRTLFKRPIPRPLVFTDTDELALTPTTFWLDEDLWIHPGLLRVPSSSLVIQDTDEAHAALLGGLRVDEDYFVHGQFRIEPNRQPVLDTDETSFAALTISIDDDWWTRPHQQLLPASTRVFLDSDEDHAAPLGGLRVDDDYFVHGRFHIEPFRQPLTDTDENWFAAATISLDDEIWTQPYQQRIWTSTCCVQEPDENHAASLGGFRLDDDLWLDLRSRPATLFLQPTFVADEWFIPIDEEIVHRVWQPQWIWVTPPVGTFQDEWVPQPFGRDEAYWVAPRPLQWPTLRLPVWAEDDVLVPIPTGPPVGICLSAAVAVDELVARVLVDGLETGVAVAEISATVLDSITTTVDSTTLTATVLPDEVGGQSLSQTC